MDVTHTSPGRIILLNGTSSSGKSSIAEELVLLVDPPHLHLRVDSFYGMLAKTGAQRLGPEALDAVVARVQAGFHRAIAGLAQAGNHLVVDQVLSRPWRLPDCLDVLTGHDVTFVGVHCAPEELERRERARGDRTPGQAAGQLPHVHAHRVYDIECDTTSHTARACAQQIKDHLSRGEAPTAFDRLREAGWTTDSPR